MPVKQGDRSVSVGCIAIGVCHHHHCGACCVKVGEQFHYFDAVFGVEITGWLVGEYDVGVGDEGACYRHTLLLSARQLTGIVVDAVRHVHAFEQLTHAAAALRGRDVEIGQRQLDVLSHSELVDEVERLEDESYLAFAYGGELRGRQAADFFAVEEVGA